MLSDQTTFLCFILLHNTFQSDCLFAILCLRLEQDLSMRTGALTSFNVAILVPQLESDNLQKKF